MKNGDEHLKTYLMDDPETRPEEKLALEAHLEGCEECRRSLESYRRARLLIAPQESISSSSLRDFVAGVFSKVQTTPGGSELRKTSAETMKRRPPGILWKIWPAAACALIAGFSVIAYFSFGRTEATTQDLLASGDNGGFYEWAMASDKPSDDDVLKVVLEDM